MQQNKNISHQSGNVFIIILIGVLLFAALLYTFSRSLQTSGGSISSQQAEIAGQEILNYSRMLEEAVNRIRQNGCSENEISFETSDQPSKYNNPNSPTDNSCHIFDPQGGAVGWEDIEYGNSFIDNGNCINEIGRNTTCNAADAEILYYISNVDPTICLEINNRINAINKSTAPSSGDFEIDLSSNGFEGNLAAGSPTLLLGDTFDGFSTGCGEDNSGSTSNQYIYYHVLLAR